MYLWHGTRTTDPKMIFEGEEGFDMKFSSEGKWGRGLYFAANSDYSNHFAHTFENGEHGIFLAKVNIGNTISLSS